MMQLRPRSSRSGLAVLVPAILAVILVAGGAVHGQSASPAGDVAAAPVLEDPTATGTQLVTAYVTAIADGDSTEVGALLASGFQIVRANGDHWDKEDYLAQGLPTITDWSITDVDATQSGTALTVYWMLTSTEVVDGTSQPSGAAPRLSSFVWQDGQWLLTSHANFGAVSR